MGLPAHLAGLDIAGSVVGWKNKSYRKSTKVSSIFLKTIKILSISTICSRLNEKLNRIRRLMWSEEKHFFTFLQGWTVLHFAALSCVSQYATQSSEILQLLTDARADPYKQGKVEEQISKSSLPFLQSNRHQNTDCYDEI